MTEPLDKPDSWETRIFAGQPERVYNQPAPQARRVESRVIDRLDVIRQMPLFAVPVPSGPPPLCRRPLQSESTVLPSVPPR